MDIFLEKLIKKQKTSKDLLYSIGVILIALIFIFIIIPSIPIIRNFLIFFILIIGYVSFYLIKSRNIEFEYALTNNYFDIDMIIDGKRRKPVLRTDCKDFELVARVNSDKFTNEIKGIKNRIEAVSSMDSEGIYFAVFDYNSIKTLLFFEPGEKIIDAMWRYIPRKLYK